MIDWVIDDCLTSSDQYLSYILDENKFYNIINPDRKGGDMCQTGASAFHCHREYMEIWTKMTQLFFFLLDKEVFIVQGSWYSPDTLPNMVHDLRLLVL